ncbi:MULTISPECIES: N-6 DNA methylase [unclassified Streptomyces]|uniref:N-6 DNA methylase n=1 Tax=unclassified Streptomyces TaxID=2593676 RepID=UPI000BDD14EA|nr:MULTISPECIES: N-6 DNA methylase [unclassified Streptomyces]SOD46311.1 type I restriction enzyme M protein [Streptomyces sp. Ag82_G6-1]
MSDIDDVLVSRADIARLALVQRPAVTNWERRHQDFPGPAVVDRADGSGEIEVFRAAEILAWLERRTVPANARRPEEPAGTTYGDRFRAGLGRARAGALLQVVQRLSGPEAERFRGELSVADYLTVLLSLVYVRGCLPGEWERVTAEVNRDQFTHSGELLVRFLARAVEEGLGPGHGQLLLALSKRLGDFRVADTVQLLDGTEPMEWTEYAQAFEWLLARYSELAGRTAGDFFTPRAAADLVSKFVADGAQGVRSVHDPFVRAGELLAAALDGMADERAGAPPPEVSGAGVGEHPLALAGMNLALHGLPDAELRPGHTAPSAGPRPGHRVFDRVVTNPPFNSRLPKHPVDPAHWRYGQPPRHNANFDWLQYIVASLAQGGRAAVLMPDIAAFSSNPSERRIRSAMVEDGVVEALIALPSQLFTTTSISVTIWLLRSAEPSGDRSDGEVLFVDARRFGSMVSRTQRALTPEETQSIFRQYESWQAARAAGRPYPGTPGVSRAVPVTEIRARDHTLSPSVYLSSDVPTDAGSADPRDLSVLGERLAKAHSRARAADAAVDELLRRYEP